MKAKDIFAEQLATFLNAGDVVVVRSGGRLENVEDIGNVVATTRNGVPVRVREIANVSIGKELRTGSASLNGEEVVIGTALMLIGANSRTVSASVDERMKLIVKSLPPGIEVRTILNRTVLVDPRLSKGERTFGRNYKTEAFKLPAMRSFGNAGVNILRGPGINNWDIGIHKDTQIREGLRVQFRAELFNAFNHAQFNAPNGFYNASTSSQFGRVNSARRGRVGQFGIKIMF